MMRIMQDLRHDLGMPVRCGLIGLLCALLPLAGGAQELAPSTAGASVVEILVFRYRDPALPEPPPAAIDAPAIDDAGTVLAPAVSPPPPLPPAALRLGSLASRLQRGPYELLYHGGWLQDLPSRDRALATPLPAEAGATGLRGTLTLYRGRYVHARVDLQWQADAAGGTPALIHESRRLRGQGLQYFDNARFGVILAVQPASAPETAPAAP